MNTLEAGGDQGQQLGNAQAEDVAYLFGSFRLEPRERRLLRDGALVPLPAKALDTLLALVRHPGRLLSRDDLLDLVWPDAVIEENYLSVNISKVRTALGETARAWHYIETVPGHGYRFCGDVRAEPLPPLSAPIASGGSESLPKASPSTELLSSARRSRWRRAGIAGVAVLIVGLIVGLISLIIENRIADRSTPLGTVEAVHTLAVLPLQSLGDRPADAYLGLGLADAIITNLTTIRDLTIRPTSAIIQFDVPSVDPVEAGRALDVDAVLSGHIQHGEDQLRVTLQMVEVQDARPLWSATFDAPRGDLFVVQDTVASRVTRALALALSADERARLSQRATEDPEAYAAYLRGRYLWNQRTDASLRSSLTAYQEALAIDPLFGRAYVGLAEAYSLLAWYSGVAPADAFTKAAAAARQALALDSSLVEAHATLGHVAWQYEWDLPQAEARFQQALTINPNYATAHHWYGEFLAYSGRPTEGAAHLRRALSLNPLSEVIRIDQGTLHLLADQYDEAIRIYQDVLDLAPDVALGWVFLGMAYDAAARPEDAIRAHERALALGGRNSLWVALLGHAHAAAGNTAAAQACLDELTALSDDVFISPFAMALLHTGLGNTTQALGALEAAYDARDPYMIFLPTHPQLDPLRSLPAFQALQQKTGLVF